MKNTVKVKICGKEYALVSEQAPEITEKVASVIDHGMKDILKAAPNLSVQEAAVLYALDCVDELVKYKDALDRIKVQAESYAAEKEKYDAEISSLKEKAAQLEGLDNEVNKYRDMSEALGSENAALKKEIKQLNEHIETIKNENAGLNEKIRQLDAGCSEVSKYRDMLEKSENEKASLKAEMDRIKTSAKNNGKSSEELKKEIETLKAENEAFKKKANDFAVKAKEIIENLNKTNSNLKQENAALKEEIETLKKQAEEQKNNAGDTVKETAENENQAKEESEKEVITANDIQKLKENIMAVQENKLHEKTSKPAPKIFSNVAPKSNGNFVGQMNYVPKNGDKK